MLRLFCLITIFALMNSAIISNQRRLFRIIYNYMTSNTCLDQYGGGNPKVLVINGGDYQKWWVEEAGNGWYYIRSYRSNNVLDSNENGNVYTLAANGGHFQNWSFFKVQGYGYHIKNRATGRYLSRSVRSHDTQTDKTTQTGWGFGDDDCIWRLKEITPPAPPAPPVTRTTPAASTPQLQSRVPGCPQMDQVIGNDNGQLVIRGSYFSYSCRKIQYGKLPSGLVRIGAICRTNNNGQKSSYVDINRFQECVR